MINFKAKLFTLIFIIFIIIAAGIFGYMVIEQWNFIDSCYMTIITLSSVGFGEIHELSVQGKIFTIILIVLGLGAVVYCLTTIASVVIEGRLNQVIRRKKMEKKIKSIKKHVILCGLSEMTKVIVNEFNQTKIPFIIIDKGVQEWIELADHKNILYIDSNPLDETILNKAGIDKACGLITALKSDAQNVLVVLTARELNKDLRIVSKVEERTSECKFKRAGADAVVCPDSIGGMRLASEILRPTVVDFLDVMIKTKEQTFRIEEFNISKNSSLANKTLAEADLARKTGVIVIAIKNTITLKYAYNPTGNAVIKPGDTLITLGSIEQFEELRKLC